MKRYTRGRSLLPYRLRYIFDLRLKIKKSFLCELCGKKNELLEASRIGESFDGYVSIVCSFECMFGGLCSFGSWRYGGVFF
ncbi:MAG: hypothetical protein LBK06_08230 [Planctomycetaceae bacterium]|nr:hypothetical protein [Planctomycetaceae bacterium]